METKKNKKKIFSFNHPYSLKFIWLIKKLCCVVFVFWQQQQQLHNKYNAIKSFKKSYKQEEDQQVK